MSSSSGKRGTPSVVKFSLTNDTSLYSTNETIARSPLSSQHESNAADQSNRSLVPFTPVLTPKGDRSGDLVLLSPARTITESLTALASSTAQLLEEVWNEVGYSPEDRASQLSDFLMKFREICEQTVAEEKGVAETFRQTIAEVKDEIQRTAAALNTAVDPYLLQEHPGQTLTDELATLEAALESLRTAANAAREDLEECRDYLIECHEALGIEMDPKWHDIESDLTAERRKEFHREKSIMKENVATRMSAVIQLVRDCQNLMCDLKIEPEKDGSDLDRRIAGSLVRSKDGSFIMASKSRTDTCVGISAFALEELTKQAAELHTEKRRRKDRLTEMGAEIMILWEKLHVPEEVQREFTDSVQGLGIDTLEKGERELKRLNELKSRMLGKLIQEARQTITDLWEQIDATRDERDSFSPFYVMAEDCFNDEFLDQHEVYIGKLRARLEEMKPILRLIERREIIVRERIEYEELQKDSDRLKQRGAGISRQLMEEEKMAKRIKQLPKLTDVLTEKLLEWQEKHNEDLQYHGEFYLTTMERQEEEWNQYKADEMQRKLKKKQEEKALHSGSQPFARHAGMKARGPLADAQPRQNSRQVSQNRSQSTKRTRS